MSRRKAFTLIELLVVVAIIATLIAILLPVLSRSRNTAKDAVCKENLHSKGVAMMAFAAVNKGVLPTDPSGTTAGNLFWDVTVPLTKTLTDNGAGGRNAFYCPLSPDLNTNFNWTGLGGFQIAGYYFYNFRPDAGTRFLDSQFAAGVWAKYSKSNSIAKSTGPVGAVGPQDQELVSDVVISNRQTPASYTSVMMGNTGALNPYSTSHMQGAVPQGGNVLFLDGHVDFRNFSDMKVRFSRTASGVASPNDRCDQWF